MKYKNSKEYWNNKILHWEKSYFSNGYKNNVPLLERIASQFRAPLVKRKINLIKIIHNKIKNKTICEFGCGSGDLSKKILDIGAKKYIGADISNNAISLAKKIYEGEKNCHFIQFDASSAKKIPKADIYFGLGFIDYLKKDEVFKLIKKIKTHYVFSFPEKKVNVINILQFCYLKFVGCPKFYKFNKKDFQKLNNHNFVEYNNQIFIKNF
jgi:SAM-dependent methyltransferase